MLGGNAAARRFHGMRNRLGAGFDLVCRIVEPTTVKTPAGGRRSKPKLLAEGVPCSVRFPKANPANSSGQGAETTVTQVEVRIPVGTPISSRSRIEVANGRTYEVQSHNDGASYADCILCICVRADDGQSAAPPPPPPDPDPPPAPSGGVFTSTFQPTF